MIKYYFRILDRFKWREYAMTTRNISHGQLCLHLLYNSKRKKTITNILWALIVFPLEHIIINQIMTIIL